MKFLLPITFVLLAGAGVSNAQDGLRADTARAVDAVESPTLRERLRARAQVHAAVNRMTTRLGFAPAATAPRMLARNGAEPIARR